jgi:hypothetical protein
MKIDSGWSPICLDRPVADSEWGVLKLGAVTWCEYDPDENKALPPDVTPDPELEVKSGDLLFTRKNTYELVAACALARSTPPRLLMSDLIFRLRLRPDAEMDACFLHQLLIYPTKRREIQRLAGGCAGSMPNISKERLQSAPIEVPPLALQRDFAQRISGVEKLKAAYRTSLMRLDALFVAVQHQVFQGESCKAGRAWGEVRDSASGECQPAARHRGAADAPSGAAQSQAGGLVQGLSLSGGSWKTARRVVAKVEFHAGELFPRIGFIVTNLETPSRAVVRFYNKRGTAEQWIKEGKLAVKMTRLSCHRFRSNQVRLALSLLAYNLGNLWRRLGLPRGIENWSDQPAATTGEDRRTAGKTCALLLAIAGGRTPEPAAVRGDAGPDRVATGPDGIDRWWSGRQRSPSTASWSKERCRKGGPQMAQFRLCWFGIS